jgi:hypothetical protein
MSGVVIFGICLIGLGIALLLLARFWPEAKAPSARRIGTPMPAGATGSVTTYERAIAWPTLVDADAGDLTVEERRQIIEMLALVGEPWCAQILARAYAEETDPLREAVIDAIGRSAGDVLPTLERAYRSHRLAERYAAIDAASRRGDVELLERGLKDTDGTVALAAAYGLIRAKRRDLLELALGGRDDARANEIRRTLLVLTETP